MGICSKCPPRVSVRPGVSANTSKGQNIATVFLMALARHPAFLQLHGVMEAFDCRHPLRVWAFYISLWQREVLCQPPGRVFRWTWSQG